jgi:hypothetical protein
VTTALVVGVGAVGTRAARQLVDTPGIDRVLVTDREASQAKEIADALGGKATAIDYEAGLAIPDDVDVVATAVAADADHAIVTAAIAAGVPLASSTDEHDTLEQLRALDLNAKSAGTTVAIGCGLAPGLSDVLARHAATMFDDVDEIRVARTGWAGSASVATVRHERRAIAHTWHNGGWREARTQGETLVWFPEPIGGRDCRIVTGGIGLMVDAFPGVARVSMQLGEPPRRSWPKRQFGDEGDWGAARVEVWGRRTGAHDCIVYGIVERTAVAAGAVLAVVAARLVGALDDRLEQPGVQGLASMIEPVPFLAELSQRGVRAAVFEGVPIA